MANKHIPKLLRAIAKGTEAEERGHDIIFNVAADEIERQEGEITRLREAAETFRFCMVESGALNHVPQEKYFSQLRALEGALATTQAGG